ncbi:FxLD family lanthipeptide [Streptomyces sp. PT12]|uniref:FxLD family lanthipeptide n=1 Tax=Streptomyces sp. PT12 TaxID=1510197 RepID=UPI000DE21B77|nr:FxLD family lanthipeptide [Streptomyces sp. PT12]RBM04525.1 FxLD family lantipeptide [Streptomyces sp. PT12]
MSVYPESAAVTGVPPSTGHEEIVDGWDLDVSIVESGPEADKLIQMTDDGCGKTCQSACSTTCP